MWRGWGRGDRGVMNVFFAAVFGNFLVAELAVRLRDL